MHSVSNPISDIYWDCTWLIICGVLMKNIFSENDFVEHFLELIDSSCDEILVDLDSGDTQEIESCVKNIHHTSDRL